MPERPKGADCKSAGPAPTVVRIHLPPRATPGRPRRDARETTTTARGGTSAKATYDERTAGVAQLVELQPSKLVVEGSSPFARSRRGHREPPTHNPIRPRSTVAVHFLGKEGVASSILAEG